MDYAMMKVCFHHVEVENNYTEFSFCVAQVAWPLAFINSRSTPWVPAHVPWATALRPCTSPSSQTIPPPQTSSRSSAEKTSLSKSPLTWTPPKSGNWRNLLTNLSCGELSWVCVLCPWTKDWEILVKEKLFPNVLQSSLCTYLIITLILPCTAKLSLFL